MACRAVSYMEDVLKPIADTARVVIAQSSVRGSVTERFTLLNKTGHPSSLHRLSRRQLVEIRLEERKLRHTRRLGALGRITEHHNALILAVIHRPLR